MISLLRKDFVMVEFNKIENQESMVKLCAIQMEPKIGYKEQNVKRSIEMIHEAADNDANLIVLPELCNTGYMFNNREEVYEVAEVIPEGDTIQKWIQVAKDRNIYICAGIAEVAKDGNRCYSCALLLGPAGYIGSHRKLHLW